MLVRLALVSALLLPFGCSAEPQRRAPSGHRDWRVYGGDSGGIRYSALAHIHRGNVRDLAPAWIYDTGDAFQGSEMQCNPLVVDGVLYGTSPKMRVFALDAATGEELWSFDPNGGRPVRSRYRNRGVALWSDGTQKRILFTARRYLYAVDAVSGKLLRTFGEDGRVDLREGLGRDAKGLAVSATTPGTVFGDLLILGSTVGEALPAAPGHVRAYDVRSGEIVWTFRTIPRPGDFGYDTWPETAWKYIGGANCWAGSTLDVRRGLVYVPTGSAAFDFYGANRHGDNLFANTLLCLNARTGERVWHFQVVKHDVWDRDLPAPPSLVTVRRNGRLVDAVAQITKSGHVFVFDRENGKPLFPIEYRAVPQSAADGEKVAATQPFPLAPPPFARQRFTEDLVTRRTEAAHDAVLARLRKLRSGPQFTPPSREGTVIFPGFDGGGEWGGAAFDPETGLLYVNSNEMAWILRLVERKRFGRATGRRLYRMHCASCHRVDRRGSPPDFPSLVDIGKKMTKAQVTKVTHEGGERMSGFANLAEEERDAIAEYLVTGKNLTVARRTAASPIDLEYRIDGYNKFLDPDSYPAVAPPWGTLNAIDLDKGEIRWRIPFGEFPALAAKGVAPTGTENYGGPVVTAGGLLFIGATNHDKRIRAFDKLTGELLWQADLPASGNATPSVYEVAGRQYVVIACGGGKSGAPSGGKYVAFALPSR